MDPRGEAGVQLGEVFEQTEATAPPPQPPRKRRWLFWLLVLGSLAGALAVHGPGITQVRPQVALVITNDAGLRWFGPPARVARHRPGLGWWIPIAQHAHPISLRRRRTESIAVVVRSREGAPVGLRGAAVSYQVRPSEAARVFLRLGADGAAWDALVRGRAALVFSRLAGGEGLAALRATDPAAITATARRQLERDLDDHGFELLDLGVGRWQPPTGIADALDAEAATAKAHAALADVAAAAVESAAMADLDLQAEQDVEDATHAAILEADLEAARLEAEASIAAARRAADDRRARAEAERTALLTRATVIETVAPRDAEGLRARIDALGERGLRLLDEAILTHVLPQVDGPRPAVEGAR